MTTIDRSRVRRAGVCVFVIFVLCGLSFASWVSRLPLVRDELGLEPASLGLVIFVGSAGSLASLPLAGWMVERWTAPRVIAGGMLVMLLGLGVAVLGVELAAIPVVGIGLFVSMFGMGAWDMSMNYAGTQVEQGLGRSIMPWFHAGFSLGAVLGAAGGTLAARAALPLPTHLSAVAILVLVGVLGGVRGLLPPTVVPVEDHVADTPSAPVRRSAWTEPRTLLIGLIALAAALTEGAANDWLTLAVVDGFRTPDATGALALTVFTAAMTIFRFVGTWLLDRLGRVAVLRVCTVLSIVGLAVFGLVDSLPFAFAGAVLWGLGAALGFPVGMSAASDDPVHAARRLSVVTTIGYSAFLAGPPLLGLVAQHVGYRTALLVVLVPLVASLFVLSAARPPADRALR